MIILSEKSKLQNYDLQKKNYIYICEHMGKDVTRY